MHVVSFVTMYMQHVLDAEVNDNDYNLYSSARNRQKFHNRLSVYRHQLILDYLIHANFCSIKLHIQFGVHKILLEHCLISIFLH